MIANTINPTLAQVTIHMNQGMPSPASAADVLRWCNAVGLPVVCNRVQLLGYTDWLNVLAREADKDV